MSLQKPPFCKFNYCPDGVACMAAEKCLSIDGLPGKIEHPDGKTSPPVKESLLMDQLLKTASYGGPRNEPKTAQPVGRGTQAQDATSTSGARRGDWLEAPEALATASNTPSQVNQRNTTTPIRAYNEGATEQGFAAIVSRTLRPTPGAPAEFMSWERDRFDSTDPEDAFLSNLPHDA